ncbi:YihY/virulence factor BrkB family protein [Leifsonia sp. H3M29-4]|uniref:YihY/virulence factor BrkB family protein n=1 Tax=Salinibacterium metalliresistens TaxID=3031321 RepID=UPI0023DC71C1|nr:YihY/virulence factor BrkB family protein [Salinibacterium metalliresistens]MDF1480093.1 YihY/virulence factor BrkB family protein [Salinibacterium metalliresistens]
MTERPASQQTARGLPRSAWRYAARRAWHGFMRHRGIDSAAALSFFAALTFLPAALAVVSAVAVGNGRDRAVDIVLSIADEVLRPTTVDTLREPITELFSVANPAIGLGIGVVLCLWSVSGYATAFGRAVNSVYEVQEGRQFWRFRGTMLLLAVLLLVLGAVIVVLLATTPRIASALGLAEPWLTVWNVGRWPTLLLLITLVIAVLYYATPTVRHERMRWVSFGAVFAIIAWSLATLGFSLNVSVIGAYDRIYGWLGGLLVLLLWIYLTNLVLVLGAEFDAEVVRLRQLNAGLAAEEVVLLPMRDTRRNLMLAQQRAADIAEAKAMRERAERGRRTP